MESGAPVQKSNGALVGSVIIIIILILGAVYLLQKRSGGDTMPTENIGMNTEESNSPSGSSASASSDLSAEERELESMDIENLDSNL